MRRESLPAFDVVPCPSADLWRIRARWPDGRNRQVRGEDASVTPAMAAGVTDKRWEITDVVKVLEDWERQAA